ncbi:cytochrome P450 [Suillus lakei]|nr:cytochrome P450 [Suillus lakei]
MAMFWLISLCAAAFLFSHVRKNRRPPLPPGPRGLPLLGMIFSIPVKEHWIKFADWSQQYGDLFRGTVLGMHFVVIGSVETAEDFLEKQSALYSDRPRSIMAGELSGWGKILLLSDDDHWFRKQKKQFAHDVGSPQVVRELFPMLVYENVKLLNNILKSPEALQSNIRSALTSVALRVSHGYEVIEPQDKLVELANKANGQLSVTTVPGHFYVDIVPLLKYIPSWMPGATFKKSALFYATTLRQMMESAHEYSMHQIAAGTAPQSIMSRLLAGNSFTPEDEDFAKWAAASFYQGGADTPVSSAYAFFLAMTLYPEVQKKAQEELDSVIGSDRLPSFVDRSSLPYLEALFTELLRWHSPAPITARNAKEDFVYNDYLIPKGSTIIGNIWGMMRDERVYASPSEFRPERFLGPTPEPDPKRACFGFGRRRCPGRFLAQSSVWLVCATSLAAFNISKCIEGGVEITPDKKLEGGTICHPAPFKCSIVVRSSNAEALLRRALDEPYNV